VPASADTERIAPQSARINRSSLTQSRAVLPSRGSARPGPRPNQPPPPTSARRSPRNAPAPVQTTRPLLHAQSARGVGASAMQAPSSNGTVPTRLRHWASVSSIPQQEAPASLLQAARSRASLVHQPVPEGLAVAPSAQTAQPHIHVSANALRTLEPMLQDVADFGSEDGSCSICLGADASEVTELRCGNRHRFHRSCITTWMVASLAINNGVPRCPLCRKNIDVDRPVQGGSRRDVLDLSLQELTAVERLLEDVRFAVLEQRSVISSHVESQAVESGSNSPSTAQLRAAQLRALMLEDRVAELRSAVYELQSRLSLL